MLRVAFGLSLVLLSKAASAVQFVALEERNLAGPVIATISVTDVLEEHPTPRLKIYPDRIPEHQHLVDLLSPGFPFEQESFRSTVAGILSEYPSACKDSLYIAVGVATVSDITRFIPWVIDKRRVSGMYIGQCIQVDLPECEYDMLKTAEVDFTAGSFLHVIRQCQKATLAALAQGAALFRPTSEAPLPTSQATRYVRYPTLGSTRNLSIAAPGVLQDGELQWTQHDSPRPLKWREARLYCQSLVLDGRNWRVPTNAELAGLFRPWSYISCGEQYCGISENFITKSDAWWALAHPHGYGGRWDNVTWPYGPSPYKTSEPCNSLYADSKEQCWSEALLYRIDLQDDLGTVLRLSFPASFMSKMEEARTLCVRPIPTASARRGD